MIKFCLRKFFTAFCCIAALEAISIPAKALDRLVLDMPLLEIQAQLDLTEAHSVGDLIRLNSDLQELNAVTEGSLKSLLEQIFEAELPKQIRTLIQGSEGKPLLEQSLKSVAEIVQIEGLPQEITGRMLLDALRRAETSGQANFLGLLQQIPGEVATVNLSKLIDYSKRLQRNQLKAQLLLEQEPSAHLIPALRKPLNGSWTRSEFLLSASHRASPIQIVSLEPTADVNGRLVLISHGLWDSPTVLEGWGEYLAANGYTVLMPDHQGSDAAQQQAMLAGDLPPPDPEELRLRPLDMTALLSAVESGALLPGRALNTREVAVVGHSWGGITAIQLAGARTTHTKLASRCQDQNDPERNISWLLQCSWLSTIDKASLADSRVTAVVAVSPPLRLLFDSRSSRDQITAKILLVSGSRDWVVPPGPEALAPMEDSDAYADGHRLVLVKNGDHFNLRAPANLPSPATLAPLIFSWVNQQLALNGAVAFESGGWGDATYPLLSVTKSMLGLNLNP